MSTEFKSRSKYYFLTQYAGPITGDGSDCRRLQVTGASSFRAPYFTLGKGDVDTLIETLKAEVMALTDEEDSVNIHGIELMMFPVNRLIADLRDWSQDALTEHNY